MLREPLSLRPVNKLNSSSSRPIVEISYTLVYVNIKRPLGHSTHSHQPIVHPLTTPNPSYTDTLRSSKKLCMLDKICPIKFKSSIWHKATLSTQWWTVDKHIFCLLHLLIYLSRNECLTWTTSKTSEDMIFRCVSWIRWRSWKYWQN